MANEYIKQISLGGTSYDISAASAGNAQTLNGVNAANYVQTGTSVTLTASNATKAGSADKLATARNIAASGDVSWSTAFDGSTGVTAKATINNIPSAIAWSAVSGEVNTKLSSVYKVMGTKTVAQINALSNMSVGDVYNVSDAGTITAGGKTVAVLAGDNIVYTSASTSDKGWDKLAATVDLSPYQTTAGMTAYQSVAGMTSYQTTAGMTAYQTTAAMTGYSQTGHKHTLADITGTDKDNLVNSASSGARASAYINANESKWTSGEANQNAYGKAAVYSTEGATTVVSGEATATQDWIGFSAWGSNVKLTATSDTYGRPVIGISALNTTGTDTKYSLSAGNGLSANYVAAGSTTGLLIKGEDATSAKAGVTKASYVENNIAYIF